MTSSGDLYEATVINTTLVGLVIGEKIAEKLTGIQTKKPLTVRFIEYSPSLWFAKKCIKYLTAKEDNGIAEEENSTSEEENE